MEPEQSWKIQKTKLQLIYPHLTEDDFKFDYGMKDVMMNSLQAKIGKSREEFNKLLEELIK